MTIGTTYDHYLLLMESGLNQSSGSYEHDDLPVLPTPIPTQQSRSKCGSYWFISSLIALALFNFIKSVQVETEGPVSTRIFNALDFHDKSKIQLAFLITGIACTMLAFYQCKQLACTDYKILQDRNFMVVLAGAGVMESICIAFDFCGS